MVTHTEYDPLDRVSAVTLDPGSAPHLNLKTSYVYSTAGIWSRLPGRETDAGGIVFKFGAWRTPEGRFAKTPVVIGERIESRVIPRAREIGAKYYVSDPTAPPSKWMANNRAWIQRQESEGRQIFDIGPEAGRSQFPDETSPYYAMEHLEVLGSGYKNYATLWFDEDEATMEAAG